VQTEGQIRYYAPARYLCGLTETEWTPDFTTTQDFSQLLGEDGVKLINEGSTEAIVGDADQCLFTASLKLGVLRFRDEWNWVHPPMEREIVAAQAQVRALALPIVTQMKDASAIWSCPGRR
jgi:hypothetical protein